MTINELRKKCYELELEGKEILDKYTDEDLEKIYNGIGPDRFPDWLREIVTESAEIFVMKAEQKNNLPRQTSASGETAMHL